MIKLIKILQDKHDAFIGNRRDAVTSADADGFKKGLIWAIETAECIMEQEVFEEEYDKQQLERIADENRYSEN